MKEIYLYGLAGAADKYRIVRYSCMTSENLSVKDIIGHAAWLKYKNPTVEHVYAIDNRGGLGYECMITMKRNTIEGNVIFKDMLERDGLMII